MKLEELKNIERVYVFKQDFLAGSITRTKSGSVFEYDSNYLKRAKERQFASLAFTLPLTKKSVATDGDNLHPFFAGLLPEGLRLTALISVLKTSADDMFSLLAASGTDTIGDVFISLQPTPPEEAVNETAPSFESVSFEMLFQKSIGAKDYAIRLQDIFIPGVQPKLSAEMISFPLSLKKRNKRYVFKLSPCRFPKLVENENFFMEMAKACGLKVANTSIVYDKDGTPGLLVERFDRIYQAKSRTMERVHQEDACQFLGRYPQDKYRLSLREIAEGMNRYCTSSIIDIARLLELSAFSYIIVNGDLHAKNISLIQDTESQRVILSPAYDLVSTLPYGDSQMALQIEGRRDKLTVKNFIRFGERLGVRAAALESSLRGLVEIATPWVARLAEIGLNEKKTKQLQRKMTERLEHLSKG